MLIQGSCVRLAVILRLNMDAGVANQMQLSISIAHTCVVTITIQTNVNHSFPKVYYCLQWSITVWLGKEATVKGMRPADT